ncbi:MAG: hypothetical protein ACI4AH_06600 [Muribaculaceae bacterium]
MLSKKMRFRRLMLSIALLVVILVVLKMIQPAHSTAVNTPEHNVPGVEKCEKGTSDSCACDGSSCKCCRCGN